MASPDEPRNVVSAEVEPAADQLSGVALAMFQNIEFHYFNHRGVTSLRRATILGFAYGSTMYHPKDQFLMLGYDLDRKAQRRFATKDMSQVRILSREEAKGNAQ